MALRTLYFERLALFSKYTFCFKFGETFIALLILCFKMVIYISQCNCLIKIIKSSKCCIKKKILDVKKSIVVYTVKPWWIIIHYGETDDARRVYMAISHPFELVVY